MKSQRIDLGEYVVTIYYDDITNLLQVKIFDEGGEMIDSLTIEDDDDIEDKNKPDFNLN